MENKPYKNKMFGKVDDGAEGENRTRTSISSLDFESSASTNSTTSALDSSSDTHFSRSRQDTSTGLLIQNLSVRVSKRFALRNISLQAQSGQILCLLGPSGSGKSSLLKTIAGFLQPSCGSMVLDSQDLLKQTPQKRDTVLQFQGLALWPHLSVERQIKLVKADYKSSSPLWSQKPGELSGGQAQAAALERTFACQKQVLLLDEPFSSLDLALKRNLMRQLKRETESKDKIVLYATHCPFEASNLGSQILILKAGQVAYSADISEAKKPRSPLDQMRALLQKSL